MSGNTNEIIFIAGLVVAGCALAAGIIYFVVSKIKSIKLNAELDQEYGKE